MLYRILRIIIIPVFYLLFWPKVTGRKNARFKGKAILISNHKSMWDPLFIGCVFPRPIVWMGKQELFKNKLVSGFFKSVSTFPVRRGEGDLAAIRHSFKVLREGRLFGMFPEGTRVKSDTIRPFEPGASMIALKTDTKIVPVYIRGKYRFFHRMKIAVGEHIHLKDYIIGHENPEKVREITALLQNKVLDLEKSMI